ncbi:MAG: hypothetical protein JNM26_01615 [Ideonella sp.]|nr:hypothetical protein [Ideonella sp.]
MTASIRTAAALFVGTALVTIVSAVVLTSAPGQPIARADVPELPRVVVTGPVQRTAVVAELPRVVVTGRVQTAAVVQLPRVVVTGRVEQPVVAQAERSPAGGA